MSGIFENPLSKVRIGILYCIPVAAIRASGNDIFCFCFNSMAISFISSLYGIDIQLPKSDFEVFICTGVIPGIPSNSISEIKETANSFSVYAIRRWSPSRKLIRIFVSAKKSIFTSYLFLIRQPIQASFQRTEIFFKRWLPFTFFQFSQSLFNIRLRGSFFNCDYHTSNILKHGLL